MKVARDLMFEFEYLLERATLGPVDMLVKDCVRIVSYGGGGGDRAFDLLGNALRMAQSGLRRSPLQIAGQLYARLMGYGVDRSGGGVDGSSGGDGSGAGVKKTYVKDIHALMKKVRGWKGPRWEGMVVSKATDV